MLKPWFSKFHISIYSIFVSLRKIELLIAQGWGHIEIDLILSKNSYSYYCSRLGPVWCPIEIQRAQIEVVFKCGLLTEG